MTFPTIRLKRVCRLQSGLTVDASRDVTGDVVTSPYLRVANVQAGWLSLDSVAEISVPRRLAEGSTLRPGDVLMTEGGDLDKLGRGTVWRGEIPNCLHQNHIFAIRPQPDFLDPRYLAYVTQTSPSRHYFESTGTKTTNLASTSSSKILDLPVPYPPFSQQQRIADFLDAETARIDTLVAKREAQQILLNQRGISAAFAAIAGLNRSNERRASGLDWLGTIPAEWPVMAVGYQFEVLLGKMLNQDRARGDHLRTYLRNTNVQWDRIDTDDLLTMNFPPEEQNRYRVLPGDLLICEGGEPGRAAIWNGSVDEIYYQKALHRVRPRSYSSSRWLYYCMRAATAQNVFAIEGNTTTIAHLTGEQLRAHRFPFPPRPVQDKLTDELDAFQRQQNRLAIQLARQQSLLGGRRQALITATVTGQIDVSTASGRGVTEEVSL